MVPDEIWNFVVRDVNLKPDQALICWRIKVNRALKPIIYPIAAIYFLVDAIFVPVVKPITRWLSTHWIWKELRAWIVSLRPYPTLLLFAVPLIVLEPVKPVAAYLAATGHVAAGVMVLVIGELLKLVLVERLFSITRNKLMSIPAFAWGYRKYSAAKDLITQSAAWQWVQRWTRITRYAIRSFLLDMKSSRRLRLVTYRSR
jgi:hypothetical protein